MSETPSTSFSMVRRISSEGQLPSLRQRRASPSLLWPKGSVSHKSGDPQAPAGPGGAEPSFLQDIRCSAGQPVGQGAPALRVRNISTPAEAHTAAWKSWRTVSHTCAPTAGRCSRGPGQGPAAPAAPGSAKQPSSQHACSEAPPPAAPGMLRAPRRLACLQKWRPKDEAWVIVLNRRDHAELRGLPSIPDTGHAAAGDQAVCHRRKEGERLRGRGLFTSGALVSDVMVFPPCKVFPTCARACVRAFVQAYSCMLTCFSVHGRALAHLGDVLPFEARFR